MLTTHDRAVAKVAFRLWESAGRPCDKDLELWLTAEAIVQDIECEMTIRVQPFEVSPASSLAAPPREA